MPTKTAARIIGGDGSEDNGFSKIHSKSAGFDVVTGYDFGDKSKYDNELSGSAMYQDQVGIFRKHYFPDSVVFFADQKNHRI